MRDSDPRIVLGLHRSRHERRLLTGALDVGVTAIDTSANYLGFRSHEVLARTAGDLLPKFTLSTKVGYFPGVGGVEHSLDPVRLHAAVEHAVRVLGREPDLVFLHNPEHSLSAEGTRSRDRLAEACATLSRAAEKGLCVAWGIATWDPTSLPPLIEPTMPKPSVLMVRAGLLVGSRTLDADEALTTAWGLDPASVRGMSPFGGSVKAPVWGRIDPRVFIRNGIGLSRTQAAFRVAYRLPEVSSMAVGTDEPAHLGELLGALVAEPDERVIGEYRRLLRDHTITQPA
ncbi:aldo/keto reductase [Streptomyces sp. AC563]|uniref:aldo/keto reductase n=1 Tax=Streptomyces buecherae TaxID=2763006 RepID=UPI00164E988C|nr:aldo/keto reductase [Streptomyces buecherae]MBC3989621.1 aldo/keto reductase [Streptomyces buecherae]